ncbi:hypothetical protein KR200_000062 [Drosophila serrata]|nr:hypothetical protein KR200_000062 [Drosophila serrata]
MANDKKAHKKKAAPKKKDKKSSKSKGKKTKEPEQVKKLAKICRIIAVADLIHALYFALQTIIGLVLEFSAIGLLALVGVAFWVANVLLLMVGLWKRRPNLVRYWLLFSLAGFVLDILFLLWGVATSITVDWDRLGEFTIIFIGIFIESGCIYVIYRYYQTMNPKKKICCKLKS